MGPLAISEPRKLIGDDWEPTAFSARLVETEKLRCLLESANRTPSYLNQPSWHFMIATKDDSDEYERLVSCLSEVNVEWARRAPVLMLSVVALHSASNEGKNTHAFRDAAHAVSNLVLRAKAMGLAAQQMAGFDAEKVRERFQIPSGFAPATAIALGYAIDVGASVVAQEPDGRGTRPLESFVFTGGWGRPSHLVNGDRKARKQ